jgi:hypothetical protein
MLPRVQHLHANGTEMTFNWIFSIADGDFDRCLGCLESVKKWHCSNGHLDTA